MKRIKDVRVLDSYQMALVFNDGVKGTVDLSHLVGKGIFDLWRDYKAFKNVKIGSSGELVWGDQIDLCPDALYMKVTSKKPEDVFQALKPEIEHA